MRPEILIAPPADLAGIFALLFEAEARQALARRGRFSCAVPGGSAAEVFFPPLARLALDWGRVDIFWVDERAVPASDPESNYSLARRLWLSPAGIPPERVHRMGADGIDLPAAAAASEDDLIRTLGRPPRLDLGLLGIGPDGHVASLFPGHVALDETERCVAAVPDAPKPPPRRLTLTFEVLAEARLLVFGAFGDAKAAAIRDGVTKADSPLPVARLLREASRAFLFVDQEAASLLSASDR